MTEERVKMLGDLFQRIHNNWVKKNSLQYVVIPSADIRGKSLEFMKTVSYRVGIAETDAVKLDVNELTAFFRFMTDQMNQLKQLAAARKTNPSSAQQASVEATMNFAPTDAEIKGVLAGIQFTIKLDGPGGGDVMN